MSTGMSTEEEIVKAVEIGKPDVIFHTCSEYPAPVENINLEYISWIFNEYPECQIGYSGHEYGLTITYAAAAMGVPEGRVISIPV
jgi:N-acetylneuraminate synthase